MGASLLTIRNYAKEIADLNNSQFVTDTAWATFINAAQNWAFGKIANLHEDYFLTTSVTPFVISQQDYSLPADFWKIRGVDVVPGGDFNQAYTLYPFNFDDRNRLKYLTFFSPPVYTSAYRYRVLGETIRFEPIPTEGNASFQLWYIKFPSTLSADVDTTIIPSLFTEQLATYAAFQALRKQEVDTTDIQTTLQVITENMLEAARQRRADASRTVSTLENDYEGQNTDGYHHSSHWLKNV